MTVEDPNLEYEARDDRRWGAFRELVDLVDERARRFRFRLKRPGEAVVYLLFC
jgi:hypothetical protein